MHMSSVERHSLVKVHALTGRWHLTVEVAGSVFHIRGVSQLQIESIQKIVSTEHGWMCLQS